MAEGSRQLVEVDGRRLRLTNLEKVMYPETGMTKGEVVSYYAEIAPVMVPLVAGRPVTRKRWVHGVGTADDPAQPFFEKNLAEHAPEWVRRGVIQHSDGPKTYPIAGDRATLVWLAQQASLEVHVPQWRFDAQGHPANPDRMVFDLDPGEGMGLAECAEVARLVRDLIAGMGLELTPVTSGSKGIHLYAALDGSQTSQQVSDVAHELARALEADHPELIVSSMRKTLRTSRVLIDWSQNNGKKTTIAPYSLRGRRAPDGRGPAHVGGARRSGTAPPRGIRGARPGRRRGRPDAGDHRAIARRAAGEYLSMRIDGHDARAHAGLDAGASRRVAGRPATIRHPGAPRPAPALRPAARARRGAQELGGAQGRARDIRRQPSRGADRGPPDGVRDVRGHHPGGEYGAGSMTIWDTGTYATEKWRDDEVIVDLDGQPGGPLGGVVRVALIRTDGSGEKSSWLLHRMKDQRPGHWSHPERHPAATSRRQGRTPSASGRCSPRPAPSACSRAATGRSSGSGTASACSPASRAAACAS